MRKREENVYTVTDETLDHISKQAYLLGLSDAPSIMGKRGREVQLEGGRNVDTEHFHRILIDWETTKVRISRRIKWEYYNLPNREL